MDSLPFEPPGKVKCLIAEETGSTHGDAKARITKPNLKNRHGQVETHSRWFTGPMLYQLATAPGSQKVKLYFEASKIWGMLFTFPLEISEDRKHTDEGFTGVGGWQGRRVSSVIRCHEREVWGPPYPCSQTAWKPVLRVPPAGAQT